ncbi:MAG: hypothetical protein IJJ76_09955 [Ruminococcus sp.]|uniref:hypothetical protein n=1 Tax=Ruminococcus sp. TaxID=41978 RepID=UPI0025F3EA4E|nr:hypothetical protein [Ruminococcus sp.]MBQ9541251.1 hypothetical protein [Ruminococcus sp.]MBR0530067.1 hypothetical protein [Ruminococcus sp.]
MARLKSDVTIDDEYFEKAKDAMDKLVTRTGDLKKELSELYKNLITALDSETGDELELAADDVVLKPIENLELVLIQVRDTLELVMGGGYYHDIFDDFEKLQNSL